MGLKNKKNTDMHKTKLREHDFGIFPSEALNHWDMFGIPICSMYGIFTYIW